MTEVEQEGWNAGLMGLPRSANPYARGWSRNMVLVMPGSLAEEWDIFYQLGVKARKVSVTMERGAQP